jgi:hypothetical protein
VAMLRQRRSTVSVVPPMPTQKTSKRPTVDANVR